LEDLNGDGRIILEWILDNVGRFGMDYLAQDRDQCEHGNGPSGTIKGGVFLS
jgi:hypothetical protein